MPAYLIRHTGGQRGDMLIEDPALTLTLSGTWAVFSDQAGVTFTVPAEQVASIQRIDEEPAPKE